MKTYFIKSLIICCITLINWSANAQNNSLMSITNAPYTDTENGAATFDYISANAVSWTWYRIIDNAEIFSRADDLSNIAGATYSPARVGKYVLKYVTAANTFGVIHFDIDIKDSNPCPNGPTNLNQVIYYAPNAAQIQNVVSYDYFLNTSPQGTYPFTYQWVFVSNNQTWLNITTNQNGINNFGLTRTAYVVITDANGCTAVVKNEISNYNPPIDTTIYTVASGGNNTTNDCSKSNLSLKVNYIMTDSLAYSGRIEAHGSGGAKPYQYSLNSMTYSDDSVFLNIDQFCYLVKIKDSIGCEKDTFLMINMNRPINSNPCDSVKFVASSFSIEATDSIQCNGSISIKVSGGTLPYVTNFDNQTKFNDSTKIENLCAGNYVVQIIDSKGCTGFIGDSVNIGIPKNAFANLKNELEENSLINVYPNPFSNEINVFSTSSDLKSLKITDLNGKVLIENEYFSETYKLNSSTLDNGVYLITITEKDKTISKKIIKQ